MSNVFPPPWQEMDVSENGKVDFPEMCMQFKKMVGFSQSFLPVH